MILVMILLVLLPVIGSILSNRKQDRLYTMLKHETVSKAYTIRHASYIHYERYNVCLFVGGR